MKGEHDVKVLEIGVFNFEDSLFDDKPVIVECTLGLDSEYITKAMIDNGCTGYSFIDTDIAHQVCEALGISPLKLNKPRGVKGYDGRRGKDITHAIYPPMTIQNHTESSTPMMITKLGQHPIILGKPWMKKHGVSYHGHDDSISFHPGHCSHLGASGRPFPNQPTKKKDSFRERIFSDQSELTEDKEIKVFPGKANNSPKMILKRPTSIEPKERLIERTKRLIEPQGKLNKSRRMDEPWRKELRKIETPPSRILRKGSRINPFYDEISSKTEDEYLNDESESAIEIHSIAAAPFNTLSRQKDVEIFAVSMKDLEIQLKKQGSSTVTDPKSVVPSEYHDFLDVFSKEKADILPPHRKHDHRIELEKGHESGHGYAPLYNLSEGELQLVKKYLKEHLDKGFIESSTAPYASPILFAKKPGGGLRFCVDYRKLNAITKKNRYPIPLIAETIARLSKAK